MATNTYVLVRTGDIEQRADPTKLPTWAEWLHGVFAAIAYDDKKKPAIDVQYVNRQVTWFYETKDKGEPIPPPDFTAAFEEKPVYESITFTFSEGGRMEFTKENHFKGFFLGANFVVGIKKGDILQTFNGRTPTKRSTDWMLELDIKTDGTKNEIVVHRRIQQGGGGASARPPPASNAPRTSLMIGRLKF